MNIRKAVIGDLPQITSIYAYARELMKDTGNATQWKTTYPTEGKRVSIREFGMC